MKDIVLHDDMRVVFCKRLWDDSEIVLAKCYGFKIDNETGEIESLLMNTSKLSIYTFVRHGFRNFSENLQEQDRRDAFYTRLEQMYSFLEGQALQLMEQKLSYYPKLYIHQKEGVFFGLTHRACLLAFQMRLGKSITAASLSKLLNVKRTIIICPAIAKWVWYRDLTNDVWGFNSLFFTMLDPKKSKSFRALNERFVIVNYDILKKNFDYLVKEEVGHFIIDECHRIKNRNSDRSKILQEIVDRFPDAKITLLSGTPIPNRFDDLFNYFKLTKHTLGESFKKFTDEYTVKTTNRGGEKVTGARNIQDLKNKMSNFMLIKRMEDCFDMPEDVISRYTFQLDDYREEYENVIREMAAAKNMAAQKGNLHTLNIITCKSKMPGMIEAIEEIIAENGKIVVFGTYKEPLAILEEYFKDRCVKVDGSVSSFEREALKQRFWEDDSIEVFLGNYDAAGEALDLSNSSDVFIINFPMTPKSLYQALFRCKHPEKRSHLRIHMTFCEESVDEDLYDLVIDKERDINALMTDGKEVVARENIHEILIKRILERSKKNGIIDADYTTFEEVSGEESLEASNDGTNDMQPKNQVATATPDTEVPLSNLQSPGNVGTDVVHTMEKATIHPEYPAKGYDSTVGFPKLHSGDRPVPAQPSFEVMAALVDNNEKNGNMFFESKVGTLDLTGVKPIDVAKLSKNTPNITQEEIDRNWEHVRKTREEIGTNTIPQGDGIFHQMQKDHMQYSKVDQELKDSVDKIIKPDNSFEPPSFD